MPLASALVCAAVVALPVDASAASLAEEIEALLETHKRIRAAEADLAAARERNEVAHGEWYPSLGITSNYGYEEQRKGQGVDDTSMPPRELNFSITQLLWDFGGTEAAIDRADLQFRQARSSLTAARQSVMLEAVTAYLDVLRRHKLVRFAGESVDNIKRQTEIESARVQRGAGLSTDVLQAKSQLNGAEARLVQAEGALKVARNRYRTVYGHETPRFEDMSAPASAVAELPGSLQDAIDTAVKDNPQLRATNLDTHIALADVRETRAEEFFPEVNAVAESNYKDDFDGTIGGKQEQLVKVELTYDLNLGLTAINSLKASKQAQVATENRYGDARDQLEEQVRNAWDNMDTARRNAEHLRNQADIAAEFLELARKERSAGKRSLIDVLTAETELINANSDATSAETDVELAVYNLLAAMGHLEVDVLQP